MLICDSGRLYTLLIFSQKISMGCDACDKILGSRRFYCLLDVVRAIRCGGSRRFKRDCAFLRGFYWMQLEKVLWFFDRYKTLSLEGAAVRQGLRVLRRLRKILNAIEPSLSSSMGCRVRD